MKINSERAKERWKVLLVEWNGYDDLLNVSMYNFGKINLNIVDVYINGFRVDSYQSIFPIVIVSSKVGEVSFTSPTTVTNDEFYEIIIVSQRGISCVYHWES